MILHTDDFGDNAFIRLMMGIGSVKRHESVVIDLRKPKITRTDIRTQVFSGKADKNTYLTVVGVTTLVSITDSISGNSEEQLAQQSYNYILGGCEFSVEVPVGCSLIIWD